MEKQREEITQVMPHDFALFFGIILYLGQRVGGYLSHTKFWKEGLSDEQFRKEAATYIERLKANDGNDNMSSAQRCLYRYTSATMRFPA